MISIPPENRLLHSDGVPVALKLGILDEASKRDLVTARRVYLLSILWQEGFLSRDGLVARVEMRLGRGCFGKSKTINFGRDVRMLRELLESEGYHLNYSRRPGKTGYYIPERPDLAPNLADRIWVSMSEVDRKQHAIFRRLSPATRVRQAGRLSDHLRRIATDRIQKERPDLSYPEAHREVLHRYWRLGE